MRCLNPGIPVPTVPAGTPSSVDRATCDGRAGGPIDITGRIGIHRAPRSASGQRSWRIRKGPPFLMAPFRTADYFATSSEDIVVRRPSAADIAGLALIFSEMQNHYGRPVSDVAAQAAATLACRPPAHTFDPHILVAGGARGSLVPWS